MSLAPKERRALAGIEEALRRSDPRLATMLTTFTMPPAWNSIRRWRSLHLRRSRTMPFFPVALAIAMAGLAILAGLLLGHSRQPLCPSLHTNLSASVLASSCQRGAGTYNSAGRAQVNDGAAAQPSPGK